MLCNHIPQDPITALYKVDNGPWTRPGSAGGAELQEEPSTVAAIAEVQPVQGGVWEAADEMEVAEQRQPPRGRRRELAFAPAGSSRRRGSLLLLRRVLHDVEEAEKQGDGAGEHQRRHIFSYSG